LVSRVNKANFQKVTLLPMYHTTQKKMTENLQCSRWVLRTDGYRWRTVTWEGASNLPELHRLSEAELLAAATCHWISNGFSSQPDTQLLSAPCSPLHAS
jgi:hypothetical protein